MRGRSVNCPAIECVTSGALSRNCNWLDGFDQTLSVLYTMTDFVIDLNWLKMLVYFVELWIWKCLHYSEEVFLLSATG